MSRKIFISVLGTSPYLETRYYFGNKPNGNEKALRFVQEASISEICQDWNKSDAVRIFLTKDAEKANWVDNGNKGFYQGLKTRLDNLGFEFDLQAINIEEGFSEIEIWNVFTTVFDEIEDDAEIYFDITHAFRSIPMLVMVLINYSKFLKNVKVKGIYYGAFEKLGPVYKVKDMSVAERFAPIIDLTAFSVLQDWTSAASDFVGFGNADKLYELTKKGIKPFAMEYKGKNETINSINRMITNLPGFISNIETCRGVSITINKEGAVINENLNMINEDFISPLKPILQKIEEKVYTFQNEDNLINGFNAVKWCIDNDLIQQGYTLLQENMISLILEELKMDIKNLENRNIVSASFKIKMANIDQADWKGDAGLNVDLTQRILKNSSLVSILAKDYNSISEFRNDMNHAGYRPQPIPSKTLKASLNTRYCSVLSKINLSC